MTYPRCFLQVAITDADANGRLSALEDARSRGHENVVAWLGAILSVSPALPQLVPALRRLAWAKISYATSGCCLVQDLVEMVAKHVPEWVAWSKALEYNDLCYKVENIGLAKQDTSVAGGVCDFEEGGGECLIR